MKLTLTRGQIHDARDTLIWIRTGAQMSRLTGGFPAHAERTPGSKNFPHLSAWAVALEDAIAKAEGKDADPRQPGPVSDADERAFWREAYALAFTQCSGNAEIAVSYADKALAGYRKAFCAGMPSDQKESDR